jgi:hypothetical protein
MDAWKGGKKEGVEEGMYFRNGGYFVVQFRNG